MAVVVAVSASKAHGFSKAALPAIRLLTGLGVEGDAHLGKTTQHLYLVRKKPSLPNLCQVHLIHHELLDELLTKGFDLKPGEMGENVTTRDIDLLGLPAGARLHLGKTAVIEVTGLRNPCVQMDRLKKGLMAATLDKDAQGHLIRKAGIMGVVLADGEVRPGDAIKVVLPERPHRKLEPV